MGGFGEFESPSGADVGWLVKPSILTKWMVRHFSDHLYPNFAE